MSFLVPKPFAAPAAVLLLLAGCGSPEAQDLSGTYILESASSAQWTAGATLTPPVATGVLRLNQYSFGVDGARGHAFLDMTYDGPSGARTSTWRGTYRHEGGGYFSTKLNDVRFEGEYMLDGKTLTTDLAADPSGSGPSPAGTIVWVRESESDS